MNQEHSTKSKFSINNFFSKCDQIRTFLRIWLHLLKKSLMENFILVHAVKQSPKVLCTKSALQNFATFIGKHLCYSTFLISKTDSKKGVFLRILQKLSEQIFHRTPSGGCFCINVFKPFLDFLRILEQPEKLWSYIFSGIFQTRMRRSQGMQITTPHFFFIFYSSFEIETDYGDKFVKKTNQMNK